LSVVALEGRSQRHHLKPGRMAGVTVVPMGSWVQRVPTASDEAYSRRRVAYLGHLVPRQGVEVLVGALAVLRDRHFAVEADILGGGPELAALQTLVSEAGLDQRVRLHGFVADHRAVEQVIADASVAVAPYRRDPDSFTRFADPGKLKVYAAAGLPMVITDVPPTAGALASLGIATVVDDTPQAVADGIQGWFADEDRWRVGHLAALEYARGFDWETQFDRWLGSQGFG
jgi:glycosyltransferase involved in cell wall biosynthesis